MRTKAPHFAFVQRTLDELHETVVCGYVILQCHFTNLRGLWLNHRLLVTSGALPPNSVDGINQERNSASAAASFAVTAPILCMWTCVADATDPLQERAFPRRRDKKYEHYLTPASVDAEAGAGAGAAGLGGSCIFCK